MTVYLLQLITIFLLWPLQKVRLRLGRSFCGKDVYLWCVFLFLFLVMALRDVSIGTDTLGYAWINAGIQKAPDFASALEGSSIPSAYTYVGMHYILSRIVYNEQIGIILNSAIVCISFYYFIKNNSHNYGMSLFLFIALCLYFESMNGCRQFMAIGVALNSYELLKDDIKSLWGWGLLFLSVGLHNTIIMFAVLAVVGIVMKRKMKGFQKTISFSIVVSALVTTGFVVLLEMFVYLFPYFIIYLDGTNKAQILQAAGNGRIVLLYIVLCGIVFLVNFFLKKKGNTTVTDNVDLFLCLVCVFLGSIFSTNVLFTRVLWPFLCIFIVYLANCFSLLRQYQRFVMCSLVFCSLGIYCALFLLEDKSSIIPYITFFSH